ncbi:cytochrome P450 3A43-like [Physella acuta]|uniref:cytochrome P450 3A43-like n=1 Tax=Physella acuta TaxID=109671 RepID=UPI0027DB7657|nr:cytochrome P450 3A43-like [Physella acuta]
MLITSTLLGITVLLGYVFYRLRKETMTIFKKLGIPGPEPNFLFGNLLEFRTTPLYKKHQEWRVKYGETFGYYEGPTPVLVTSDVVMLEEVFIKQFNNFHARKLWPVQVDPDKDEDVHMFFARGKRWKRLRSVVNPAFSAAKIRKMTPTVNECINHLLDVIRDTANATSHKTVELVDLFRRLTLDTILRCEVGIERNSLKNPDDMFLKHCKGVIDDTAKMPWLYLLGFLFPTLHVIWIHIYKFLHNIQFNPVFWLEDKMREVVVMRRNMADKGRADLMQQMLDAQFDASSFIQLETEEAKINNPYKKTLRSMTNEEIVSHALLFLLAGYETTSTTLAYIFFELSLNPQIQQRLRHEVMTVLPRGYSNIEYDDLKKLTYLDYVIWETLRKYPLASTVTARQCMHDCTIRNLKIPAGMLVHANLWDVQYDPKHWGEDPHSFNPMRFMPEQRKKRHPASWMPFGGGPRACAGLRFALLQLKMVVAKVLRDFDFHPSDKLTVPLPLKQGATILPSSGVHLSAMRRGSALTETGLRRGSVLTGIPLADWINIRRASLKEEDFGLERCPVDVEFEEVVTTSRRASVADGLSFGNSRRNSREERATRRSSILEEKLTVQGFELLRRFSKAGENNLLGNSFSEMESTTGKSFMSQRDNETNANMGVSTMPEDILGEMPQLRSRIVLRRGSAVPDLESVSEAATIEEFKPRAAPVIAEMVDGITDDVEFKKKLQACNRLYKRRGSG